MFRFTYRKATGKKEIRYIKKRRRKAALERLCFYACRIFPVDGKLVSVCTFEGKGGFGCNARPVVLELHRRNPSYKFVWFLNAAAMQKEFPPYIRKVPNTVWGRAYWLSRSGVWIDNYRKPFGVCKRKGQYYLNVNHYTAAIKCTGLLREQGFSEMAYLVSRNDSGMIDGLVTDSEFFESYAHEALVYEGKFLRTGAPRCDVLYGDRGGKRQEFRSRHGIPSEAKVVMFAPTFREGSDDGKRFVFSERWSIDFERLLGNLGKRFGGTWYLCVRVHPQLAPTFREYRNPAIQDLIIDESQADDMYGILAGMDAYVSDYSSACMEAGFAGIPVFLYADDIESYTQDRGSLLWKLSSADRNHAPNNRRYTPDYDLELPFTIATDNGQLEEDVLKFDEAAYMQKIKEFREKTGLVFDGKASERIAEAIEKHLSGKSIKGHVREGGGKSLQTIKIRPV